MKSSKLAIIILERISKRALSIRLKKYITKTNQNTTKANLTKTTIYYIILAESIRKWGYNVSKNIRLQRFYLYSRLYT